MGVAACLRWEDTIIMANFTTTHSHDFRWPNTDCLIPRAEAPNGRCEVRPGDCTTVDKPWCQRGPPSPPVPTEPQMCNDLGPSSGDRPWCQRGPLVPLISPQATRAPAKPRLRPHGCPEELSAPSRPWCDEGDVGSSVVAARVGAAPQQDTSRYDQPNQYLQKLCDKFPRPTAVVTATPRDELMRRVYADRYRTTYQSDFCKNADDTARQIGECTYDVTTYNALNRFEGATGNGLSEEQEYVSCKCGCGCRVIQNTTLQQSAGDATPRLRPLACRPAAVSHNVHFSCCSPKSTVFKSGEEAGPPEKLPPWASEYSDSIGHTGQLIMDQKLHYQNKKKY